MTDEQFRQLAEQMGQMEARLTSRMEGMETTLNKVKNDTTVLKRETIQINSRLGGVEGDIRHIKTDVAKLGQPSTGRKYA